MEHVKQRIYDYHVMQSIVGKRVDAHIVCLTVYMQRWTRWRVCVCVCLPVISNLTSRAITHPTRNTNG